MPEHNSSSRREFLEKVGSLIFTGLESPGTKNKIKLSISTTGSQNQPRRYYAHEAVLDPSGVIAPWYQKQNGQIDWRIHLAAETLKRYPWTEKPSPAPHYVFNGHWQIAPNGQISIPELNDWDNGDLGERMAYILTGLVDYYRYTGDAAALAHITLTANALLDFECTGPRHPWPGILVSAPTCGKPYGQADSHGLIQLDIVAEAGIALLRAYEMTGETRWFEAAKGWADLFARHRRNETQLSPWPRYANPEDAKWEDIQTGGVVFILEFLDEAIRCGYTGHAGEIIESRDAGRRFLRDTLLPKWTVNDTWGRNYWDWHDPVQAENVTEFVGRYLMANPKYFTNWRNDVRNILSLFLNRTSVSAESSGGVFSGAWAYPESSVCCGKSLWYGPLEIAPVYAEYGVRTGDSWALEMARRQMILATYDAHETGVVEDNIDGGAIVADAWFKIAHPMALKHCLNAIAWQPDIFGPSRENHIVRASSVVRHVVYGKGRIEYETFDAPSPTEDVLRLSFVPSRIEADGRSLPRLPENLKRSGWSVHELVGGDCLVHIRHDGMRDIVLEGSDPQIEVKSQANICTFTGNQARVLGAVGPDGGLAEVILDGVKQPGGIDCWSPVKRERQTIFTANGLSNEQHVLEVRALGKGNPVSKGASVHIEAYQYSDEACSPSWGSGGGPTGVQRVIFGYSGRRDYLDSSGGKWRPAAEWIVRLGNEADSVKDSWWTEPTRDVILGTVDQELYRYGAHAKDITAFFTLGPGNYSLRLHFVETRQTPPIERAITICINGSLSAEKVDIAATAGGMYRAAALVFGGIQPVSGVIELRVFGSENGDAIIQAAEVIPGEIPAGARVISV